MSCEYWRESVSARLDGERGERSDIELEAHLEGCRDCTAWLASATELRRHARVSTARPHIDQTEAILARVPLSARPQPVREPIRWGLLAIGLLQVTLALQSLLLSGIGTPVHLTREMGAFELALGVAMMAAWHRPRLATGMVPFAASLAGTIVVVSITDVARGQTAALSESHHVIDLIAVALLLSLQVRMKPRPNPALSA